MKIIVAGGRDFGDFPKLVAALDMLVLPDGRNSVLSGGANGADDLAERWADESGMTCDIYEADWDAHGKAAGPIRNQQMAQDADALIAFWDGKSRGTKDMIEKAVRAGLEIHVYRYRPEA